MNEVLVQYKREVDEELKSILQFWIDVAVDEVNGGFIGRVDNDNQKFYEVPKGSVLNSRILWSFSAAYSYTGNGAYLPFAKRAFDYIRDHFLDKEYGGVYWAVSYQGEALDTKKQIYALAFAVYGLSEYYIASKDETAKNQAVALYRSIITHSYDEKFGGYREALSRDWKAVEDIRLSAKDANSPKSMNTHLHILEAFATLYCIWPDEGLKEKLVELVQLFLQKMVSPQTGHLILFFDDNWTPKSNLVSYGHDIEAAWLVQEAAEIIGDEILLQEAKATSLRLAKATTEGLDSDGGLWYEYDSVADHLIKQKHWWPQAEAMVGFFNAGQVSGEEVWLQKSRQSWQFVKDFIRSNNGEWLWGINEDYAPMGEEDKVDLWKCPYHNSRACIEVGKRIKTFIQ